MFPPHITEHWTKTYRRQTYIYPHRDNGSYVTPMDEKENVSAIRRAMMIGTISIALFLILNATGIFLDGTWRPHNMLCSLGTSDSEFVSTLFTLNCVISGIGLIVCGCGIARRRIGPWVTLAYVCVALIGIFLILIGVFDMDTDIHEPFAFGVAFMMGATMAIMSVDDIIRHRFGWAFVSATIALGLLGVLLFIPEYGQFISLISMLSWTLLRFGTCAIRGEV